MNEIIRAMEERRSVRKFKPDMVPREMIEQIIEAGLYAASGIHIRVSSTRSLIMLV